MGIAICGAPVIGVADAMPISVAEFYQMAPVCGPSVMPLTLASIAKTESNFEPFAIDDDTTGAVKVLTTPAEAAAAAHQLIAAGDVVDIGLMQINSRNLATLGLTVEAALDSCSSIAAAAALLSRSYGGGVTHEAQQAALRTAISIYNTGDKNRGFKNGYVHKVESAAEQIVPAIDLSLKATSNTSTSNQIGKLSMDIWSPGASTEQKSQTQKNESGDAFKLSSSSNVLVYTGD